MQKTDHFYKCILKWLLNGKAPSHEVDTFTHIKGLLYKHVMGSNKKFLALVFPKSWCFTVLVEAHDKLGHHEVNQLITSSSDNITGKAWIRTSRNTSLTVHCVKGKRREHSYIHY